VRWHWTVGLGASALVACARPAPPPRAAGEPVLRVALVTGVAEVTIGAEGEGLATADGAPVVRLVAGGHAVLRGDGTALVVTGQGNGRHTRLVFASTTPGRALTVGGAPYRGALEAFAANGGITVVNVLPLEDYVRGVVNAEMGRRGPSERAALEAQAVVSRTYALRNRGRYAAEGYDLRAGLADQVYGGTAAETELGAAAVAATAGQVLTWDGELIAPFFHSTCGGSTATPEEAFISIRGAPYLRPVSDRRPGGHYCDISPRFRWTVEWGGSELRDILGRTLPAQLGVDAAHVTRVRDVYVRRAGASGRAVDVRVRFDGGEVPVPAYAVRAVFATPDGLVLGSSSVRLTAVREADTVARLRADGSGWGHGVGLCQWGAVGRARAGQDAATILDTYFPGSRLAHWY
jgi:stage II sporulation protein D